VGKVLQKDKLGGEQSEFFTGFWLSNQQHEISQSFLTERHSTASL